MPNMMAALPNIGLGGALCSTPQNLADAPYKSAVQYRCQDAKPVEIFMLWFLSSIFYLFLLVYLSGQGLDVYHTSTHGVALVRI